MKNKLDSKIWTIICYGLLVLTTLYTAVNYFSHDLPRFPLLFNSDSLYFPALFNNIFNEGGSYNNWHLTPAPYFFPDMLIYFIAHTISNDFYFTIYIFSLLQGCALFICLFMVSKLFFLYQQSLVFAVTVLAMIFLFILGNKTMLVILSGHHFGAYLSMLLSILAVIKILNSESSHSFSSVLLFLLVALTVASDKLFIIQFIIPLIFSLVFFWINRNVKLKTVLLTMLITLVAGLTGYILHYLFVPNPSEFAPKFNFSYIITNLQAFSNLLFKILKNHLIYSFIFIGFYVAILYGLICALLFKKTFKRITLFVCILTVFTFAINVAIIVSSNLTITLRYFIPIFFNPLVFISVAFKILPISPKFIGYVTRVVLLLVFICISIKIAVKINKNKFYLSYYPENYECFDAFISQTKARNGISHYWDAKKTSILSREPVTVAAYSLNINPYNWISTSQWQQNRYDFALIRNSEQPYPQYQISLDLLKKFSPKQEIKTFKCNLFDIYYFPKGLFTEARL